jgi:hypothetical protein
MPDLVCRDCKKAFTLDEDAAERAAVCPECRGWLVHPPEVLAGRTKAPTLYVARLSVEDLRLKVMLAILWTAVAALMVAASAPALVELSNVVIRREQMDAYMAEEMPELDLGRTGGADVEASWAAAVLMFFLVAPLLMAFLSVTLGNEGSRAANQLLAFVFLLGTLYSWATTRQLPHVFFSNFAVAFILVLVVKIARKLQAPTTMAESVA